MKRKGGEGREEEEEIVQERRETGVHARRFVLKWMGAEYGRIENGQCSLCFVGSWGGGWICELETLNAPKMRCIIGKWIVVGAWGSGRMGAHASEAILWVRLRKCLIASKRLVKWVWGGFGVFFLRFFLLYFYNVGLCIRCVIARRKYGSNVQMVCVVLFDRTPCT